MTETPARASAVVIGAGIVGNSLVHHLARLGWRDLVLVDKGPMPNPGGSTGHASNFIFPIEYSKMMFELTTDSTEQYQALGVFTQSGGLEVARTPARMQELHRRCSQAKSWGIPAERTRLLRMAAVAGASESARFITRHPGWILRFWVPGGYSPDRLLDRAAAVLTAPGSGVAGLHLFTFNQLQQAELWRRAALERTGIDKPLLAG